MVETKLPDFPYGAVVATVIAAEGGSVFESLIRSGKVDQLADAKQIAGLKASLDITATERISFVMKEGKIVRNEDRAQRR